MSTLSNKYMSVEDRLDNLDRKMDVLVDGNHPRFHEFMSGKLLIVLIVVGILTAIWSEWLLKRLKKRSGTTSIIVSIVCLLVIAYYVKRINTHD